MMKSYFVTGKGWSVLFFKARILRQEWNRQARILLSMSLQHQGSRRNKFPMDYNWLSNSWRNSVKEKSLGGRSSDRSLLRNAEC